ncbi:tetratricopeptide repeat protein [Subsaxibacter sp. CAU 1640]|uniref:tetratricopeptide repeat protein n=1 Tax=Subsaxibacter sp. CAU 1640 TaxID=2933271 RepID=UPI0020033A6D|nr:tetratricopeptide repeat protein [Subsaxibacter sp. CAU 1640]MCK7591779.1 tetratricopeptide repeat protein [Subsaxibacter sp. CAU 1640]
MENSNLERGIQFFEMGRYKDSIPYLLAAISDDNDNYLAKYLLAQCHFQNNDIDKALQQSIDLRSEEPNHDGIYLLLSQIYLHKDNSKEAELMIDKAIELNPYEENHFGQKAYVLINKKKYEQALEYANEGLKIDSKSTFCLNARTTALTKLNRKSEVSETINSLLHDNPDNAYSHANAGWSYLENNNRKKAFEHFKEALSLNPNLDYARSGMSQAVKSKNWVYNLYLRYAFWISNKSTKNQWLVIIGIYLVYRFSLKVLTASGLTYLAFPLIILYLLFALGTWIMDPLSNMILMFDKFGKYLLDEQEKLTGQLLFALLCLSLITFLCSLFISEDYLILFSLTFLAVILPFTRATSTLIKRSRFLNMTYGSIMFIICFGGFLMGYPMASTGIVVGIMFIAYTWIGNFISNV